MVADSTIKATSLVVFTVQNAAFVLLMRASKLMGTHYNSAVAVLVTEVLKLPLTLLLLCFEKRSISEAGKQLYADIALQPMDTLKISIPALLYTIQNNALFIAVGHLEAAVFQVTYQLKTLTTAVLTVVLLGRAIKRHQWFALLLLSCGAAMVQEPKKTSPTASGSASGLAIGIAATVVACVCSSVASVYLEKILVESKPSIWVRPLCAPAPLPFPVASPPHRALRVPLLWQVRNAQLCIFTIPIAWAGALMVEDPYMKEDGSPLHGFNRVVWAAIFTNAAGGMIVAVVMKFAGNILRNFAQALAIVVGGLGSWILFDFKVTLPFVVGVGLVILSIFIYGSSLDQLGGCCPSPCARLLGVAAAPQQYELVAQAENQTRDQNGAPSPPSPAEDEEAAETSQTCAVLASYAKGHSHVGAQTPATPRATTPATGRPE